ncbi:MAG: RluA family pseudouridine synthase [Anaerobacillus sp.]
MTALKLNWTVEKVEEILLREFLLKEKGLSRSLLTDIKFNGGSIHVNGEVRNVRTVLQSNDVVEVTFPDEKVSESMLPIEMPLRICYEDEHFLLVNKKAHLPTIPSRHSEESLAQGVLYYYDSLGLKRTIHTVNRLDRDTSGLVLFAKHRFAHDLLSKQQKSKQMKRLYLALVHGEIEGDGRVDTPIGRKEGSIIERCVREDGQHAVTHYKTLEKKSSYSLLELGLETGRTHQIRVHMASIGHPLLGDDLYGGTKELISRQALHSSKMEFHHPFLNETLDFEAELEEDMCLLTRTK